MKTSPAGRVTSLSAYLVALILSLGILLAGLLASGQASLSAPFEYRNDALFTSALVKGTIENGWFLTNPRLGMPGILELGDFPMTETVHFIVIKLIAIATPDFAVTMNLYYLLTFPLTTLISMAVFRHFQVSSLMAIVGSILFTYLPYHMLRCESHLFLSAYYLVPLMVMVCLWIAVEDPVPFFGKEREGKRRFICRDRATLASGAVCVLVASSGIYYAFFGCALLFASGVSGCCFRRRVYPIISAGLLIGLMSLTILANISPCIHYVQSHGPNPECARRTVGEAEIYGLKPALLILPQKGHRIPTFGRIKARYIAEAPFVNETDTATLGLIGSAGFLFLLGRLLDRRPRPSGPGLMDGLTILNGAALALGTVGGAGTVFNLLVSPSIRAYTRISVYIACCSLLAAMLLLDKLRSQWASWPRARCCDLALACLVLAVGLADQTKGTCFVNFAPNSEEFQRDRAFARAIEDIVPENAMIFQLPYTSYPEGGKVHGMADYDHLRGYLHSRHLRWSCGAIKGREIDAWQRAIATYDVPTMIRTLSFTGFGGIYLNRTGYADMGARLERDLRALLGKPPIVSEDGKLAFFNLADHTKQLRDGYSDAQWVAERDRVLPVLFLWGAGFYEPEKEGSNSWRWCRQKGEVIVSNLSQQARDVYFDMDCQSHCESDILTLSGILDQQVHISRAERRATFAATVPPGRSVLRFACGAPRVSDEKDPLSDGQDPRDLVFRILNFSAHVVE